MATTNIPALDQSRLAREVAALPLLRDVPGADIRVFAATAARQITDAFCRRGPAAAIEQAWRTGWRAGERGGQHDAADHITRSANDATWRGGVDPRTRELLNHFSQRGERWRSAARSDAANPDLRARRVEVPFHELVGTLATFAQRHPDRLHFALRQALLHGAHFGRYSAAISTNFRLSGQIYEQAKASGIDLHRVTIAGRRALDWLANPSRAGLRLTDVFGYPPALAPDPLAVAPPPASAAAHLAAGPTPHRGSGPQTGRLPASGAAPAPTANRPRPSW